MSVVRRIARPLLATQFVTGGLNAARNPAPQAAKAAPVLAAMTKPLGLRSDPELMVRVNGITMVGAAAMLATGRLPRLAALVLATSLVPTTMAGHRFWEFDDPAQRTQQRLHFTKNMSLLGGLLLAVVDTGGKPGLGWRARHIAKDAKRSAKTARHEARQAAHAARREAAIARHQLAEALPFD